MTVVHLPFPPSVNNLFINVRRKSGQKGGPSRVPSPGYKAWQEEAGWLLRSQRPKAILGRVDVTIDLVAPTKARRDADNCSKAVLDLLVSHSVIEADDFRFVRRVSTGWVEAGQPCTVTIRSAA